MLKHKQLWNDGFPLQHFLTDPECPVPNSNVCFGGGGDGGAPAAPDYSNYISEMTKVGNTMVGYGADLYDWAKQQGLDLTTLAKRVGGAAETAATGQQGRSDKMMDKWASDYEPLYGAQRADAMRMYADLPGTEEHYAGKFGADAGAAIDRELAAENRKQQSMGISPGIASTALDTQARIGRAAATTAAAEQGRMQARTEARNVGGQAIQTGQFIPGVAGQQAGLATANRGQSVALPATAASTAAGLYQPSLGYYQAATPYKKAQFEAQSKGFDQSMEQYKANQENDSGGFMSTIAPLAGGIAGSFFGPMGSMIGSSIGKMAGSAIAGAKSGGKIPANGGRRIPRGYAKGGAIDTGAPMDDHMITPEMSPSGGQGVDDVHAMVSEGEFVIPERTVDWYGEKFFQNLIAKADTEAQEETVAAPEEVPVDGQQAAALDTMPPQFRSEGARV